MSFQLNKWMHFQFNLNGSKSYRSVLSVRLVISNWFRCNSSIKCNSKCWFVFFIQNLIIIFFVCKKKKPGYCDYYRYKFMCEKSDKSKQHERQIFMWKFCSLKAHTQNKIIQEKYCDRLSIVNWCPSDVQFVEMAGQKFQYDESGGTFFYFLLSFLALILIPATLYYWPRKKKEGKYCQLFGIHNI